MTHDDRKTTNRDAKFPPGDFDDRRIAEAEAMRESIDRGQEDYPILRRAHSVWRAASPATSPARKFRRRRGGAISSL
jgi:hypothetical protein